MNRQEELNHNLLRVKERIKSIADHEVTLIVVTKTFPLSDVQILYELGVRDFGENRDSEGKQKAEKIDANWHFQGQIQGNKIKSVTHWANVIHSLDELRHFEMIEKFSTHPLSIFLQFSIDGSESRGGASLEQLLALAEIIENSKKHTLAGVMSVPPVEMDALAAYQSISVIHKEFLRQFPQAKNLSAGMSGDFELAIEHGATHVRIGSSILGSRITPL